MSGKKRQAKKTRKATKPINGPSPEAPPKVERNADGTLKAGTSLRKASMKSRAKRLSRRIGQATKNGASLVDWSLEIARNKRHPDRLKAIDKLWNRYAGKEPTTLEVLGEGGGSVKVSMSGEVQHVFEPERVAAILEVLRGLGALPEGAGPSEIAASGDAEANTVHPT